MVDSKELEKKKNGLFGIAVRFWIDTTLKTKIQ